MKTQILSLFTLLLLLTGCSEQEAQVITDSNTNIELETIENITTEMEVIHSRLDEMDRGNHDFFDKDIVVESNYYEKHPIQRGDIIAFKKETDDDLVRFTRVIAMEGEKVKISTAQFYIDGKKLDTFYGRGHRLGKDLDDLKNAIEQGVFKEPNIEQNMKYNVEDLENLNEEEITVPEGYVYVTGDDWFRSGIRGILPKENIMGKVLGYK